VSDRQFGVTYGQPHMVGRPRSYTTYNRGCRCDDCREAWRIKYHQMHAIRAAQSATGHPDGRPVSYTTYRNWGCRCEGCRAAHVEKLRDSGAGARWRQRQRKAAS
jgi:hypothetical protein